MDTHSSRGRPPLDLSTTRSALLHQTYELYLDAGEDEAKFEVLTCEGGRELISVLRRMIEERDLVGIEVRQQGRHLFTLAR